MYAYRDQYIYVQHAPAHRIVTMPFVPYGSLNICNCLIVFAWELPQRAVRSESSAAMAGMKRAAALTLCLVVVLAMVADSASAAGVCNANALRPCLGAIQGACPPPSSRQYCSVVMKVDKKCMYNQLKSSSFSAQMVSNGLLVPKKCGLRDLNGFKCGRYRFPK